jgi:hypothetical protein
MTRLQAPPTLTRTKCSSIGAKAQRRSWEPVSAGTCLQDSTLGLNVVTINQRTGSQCFTSTAMAPPGSINTLI